MRIVSQSDEHTRKLLQAFQNNEFEKVRQLLDKTPVVCEEFVMLLDEKKKIFNGELSPILEILSPDLPKEKQGATLDVIDEEAYANRQAMLQSMISYRQSLPDDATDSKLTSVVGYSVEVQGPEEWKTTTQHHFNISDPVPEIFILVLSFLYRPYNDSTRQDDEIYNPVTRSINRRWRDLTCAWLCHLHPQAKRQESLGVALLDSLVDSEDRAPQTALLRYFQALMGPATFGSSGVQVEGVEELLFDGCFRDDVYQRALLPPVIHRYFLGLKDAYYPSPQKVWASWGRLVANSLALQRDHRDVLRSFRDGEVVSTGSFYCGLYKILIDSQRFSWLISDVILVSGIKVLCDQMTLSTQQQTQYIFNGRHHRFMTSLADVTPRGIVTVLHFQKMYYVHDNLEHILKGNTHQLLKKCTANDLLWIAKKCTTIEAILCNPQALNILLEDVDCITEVLSHVGPEFLETEKIDDPRVQKGKADQNKKIRLLDYLIFSLPAKAWCKLPVNYRKMIIQRPQIIFKLSGNDLYNLIRGNDERVFILLNQKGIIPKFNLSLSKNKLNCLIRVYERNKLGLMKSCVLQQLKQLRPKNEERSRYESSRHIRYVPHQSNLDFQEQRGWQPHRSSSAFTTTTTTTTFSAGTRQDQEHVNKMAAPIAADSTGKIACLKTCLGYTLLTVGYLACVASIATGIGAIAGFTAATAVASFVLPMLVAKTAGGIFIGSGIASSIMLFNRKRIKEKVVSCIPCCNSQVEPGFSMMA